VRSSRPKKERKPSCLERYKDGKDLLEINKLAEERDTELMVSMVEKREALKAQKR
jgi:hypothetical protein